MEILERELMESHRTDQTQEQRRVKRGSKLWYLLVVEDIEVVEEAVVECTLSPPCSPSEEQMAEFRTIEEYEQDQLCSQALDEYEDEVCTQALDEYDDQVLLNAPVDHQNIRYTKSITKGPQPALHRCEKEAGHRPAESTH